jgi:hypothetical protein
MARRRFKSLDEARAAYLAGKITSGEFAAFVRRFSVVDHERKELEKRMKKIERKLMTV